MDQIEQSYKRHEADFDINLTDPRESSKAKKWFDKTTADYWRHARGYRIIDRWIATPVGLL